MPGHTQETTSSLVTSDPSDCSRTNRRSKARVPSFTGTPSAISCRRRRSIWKRPNSSAVSCPAQRDWLGLWRATVTWSGANLVSLFVITGVPSVGFVVGNLATSTSSVALTIAKLCKSHLCICLQVPPLTADRPPDRRRNRAPRPGWSRAAQRLWPGSGARCSPPQNAAG